MPYFSFIVLGLLLFFSSGEKNNFICFFTDQSMKIDGHLDEWEHAKSINIEDDSRKSHANASIKALWDMQNLYIAFQVMDEDLQAKQTVLDHPQLYLDDMVEFLIDSRNDKESCWNEDDIIYHINLLGQKKDDRGSMDCSSNPKWNGNASYEIDLQGSLNDPTDTDKGYVVEISIPWKELDLDPVVGLKIGMNFAIGDNGILFDWAGASPFRSPDVFGNLELGNKIE